MNCVTVSDTIVHILESNRIADMKDDMRDQLAYHMLIRAYDDEFIRAYRAEAGTREERIESANRKVPFHDVVNSDSMSEIVRILYSAGEPA